MEDFAALVVIAKDIAIGMAAAVGAYVAFKGLDAWRTQLTGQTEYELSRRVLIALYRYRDAIDQTRSPLMWGNEMPRPKEDEAKHMTKEAIRHYGVVEAYNARWKKVADQREALYPDLIEAEALWGKDLGNHFFRLYRKVTDLTSAIRTHLTLSDPSLLEDQRQAYRDADPDYFDVLYDTGTPENPDEFRQEVTALIEPIELYLKPKLRHDS